MFSLKPLPTIRTVILLIIILLVTSGSVLSQSKHLSLEKLFKSAVDYIGNKEFDEGRSVLLQIDSIPQRVYLSSISGDEYFVKDDTVSRLKTWVKYYIGLCYSVSEYEQTKAIPYFEFCNSTEIPTLPVSMFRTLGVLYHINYQFDKSIFAFQKYTERINDKNEVAFAKRMIEICNNAKELITDTINYPIQNLGYMVNTVFSETRPIVSNFDNALYYTVLDNFNPNQTKVMMAHRFLGMYVKPQEITFSEFSQLTNATIIGSTNDSCEVFVRTSTQNTDEVYLCRIEDNNAHIIKQIDLPFFDKFNIRDIYLTSTQKECFFSSNVDGGMGGYDIYKVVKVESGEWGQPINLGELVNTPFDERMPFFHELTTTLYFASSGHNTMGGFDIFKTLLSEQNWTKAKNIGFPINTVDDNFEFTVNNSGSEAYFTSYQSNTSKATDIYSVPIQEPFPFAMLCGTVFDGETNLPLESNIIMIDNDLNHQFDKLLPKPQTGKFTMVGTTGRSYSLLIQSSNFLPSLVSISLPLKPTFYELFLEIYIQKTELVGKLYSQQTNAKQMIFDFYLSHDSTQWASKVKTLESKSNESIALFLNQYIQSADSAEIEKKTDLILKFYEANLLSQSDFNDLLQFIDTAVATGDELALAQLNKVTKYHQNISTNYYYSESQSQKRLLPINYGGRVYKTIPPVQLSKSETQNSQTELLDIIDSKITKPDTLANQANSDTLKKVDIVYSYIINFKANEFTINNRYSEELQKISNLLIDRQDLYFDIVSQDRSVNINNGVYQQRKQAIIDFLTGLCFGHKFLIEQKFRDDISGSTLKVDNDKNIIVPTDNVNASKSEKIKIRIFAEPNKQ